VFEFIQRFFGKPPSSATAKERLRLVLLSDHLSLAPDVVEALKHDLIEVISRYVDVDDTNVDVSFEQQEKQVAMLANIPILGMRTRPTLPAPPPPAPLPPTPEPELTPSLELDGASASVAEPEPALQAQPQIEPAAKPRTAPITPSANGRGKRKRRRPSANVGQAPSTATPGLSGI
jgi:cell division topological specificity factor